LIDLSEPQVGLGEDEEIINGDGDEREKALWRKSSDLVLCGPGESFSLPNNKITSLPNRNFSKENNTDPRTLEPGTFVG